MDNQMLDWSDDTLEMFSKKVVKHITFSFNGFVEKVQVLYLKPVPDIL